MVDRANVILMALALGGPLGGQPAPEAAANATGPPKAAISPLSKSLSSVAFGGSRMPRTLLLDLVT